MFVVGVLSSISESRFQLIREFTEERTQRSLINVIFFSTNASVHFPAMQHTTVSALLFTFNPGLVVAPTQKLS